MPETKVYLYAEDGVCEVRSWLLDLRRRDVRAFGVCRARVFLLQSFGHELRRPHADTLRDGIYELRARVGSVNYRMLYFFHGRDVAIVSHGFTKEREVPSAEIERAIERKQLYEQAPEQHRATVDL
jgi:phage-related protein|tara:strand:- start:2356 stop:2733 length:378 start_codon:yes stop_codon:yes gene_type:complete